MLATYGAPATINRELERLNCQVKQFCAIAEIGRTNFSLMLTGRLQMPNDYAEKIMNTVHELRDLQQHLGTSPDWSNAELIQRMLDERRRIRQLLEE